MKMDFVCFEVLRPRQHFRSSRDGQLYYSNNVIKHIQQTTYADDIFQMNFCMCSRFEDKKNLEYAKFSFIKANVSYSNHRA